MILMEAENDNNGIKGDREGREEQQAFSDPHICVRAIQHTFIDVTLDHYNTPQMKVLLCQKYR